MKITRRTLLKLGLPALAGAIGTGGYSTLIEPHRLSLERVTILTRALPERFEGFRIAVLSDFHLLPYTRLPHIESAVALVNSLRPDLVVLLGDYVDLTVETIHDLAPALSGLNARGGVAAILGNHDHWKGAGIVQDALMKQGIEVLRNSGRAIEAGGDQLYLAGLDSAWAGRPDLAQALSARRGNAPIMLLVHEPDFADLAAWDPRIMLQLSGHSHGGQVRIPHFGALRLPSWGQRYDQGLYRIRDMALYTTRGIGLVGVPVRFNCPPEVTEITLRRG